MIGKNLCGTGPFKLVEFSFDERAVLEANDDYWLGRPNPLADVNVRKALAMAADWDAIRAALYQYNDAVPGYLPIPFGSWAYDASQESLAPSYDIEQAMQLMADAGYAGGFDISMYVTNQQARVDLATMLQAYWSALGVNLTPVIGEWGSYSDAVCGGKADTYAMSWSWYPDPYFFLNNLFASNQTTAIGNGAGYVNAEVDDLLLKAVQTTDQDERAKYYQQVIEIAMKDYVGVYYAVPNLYYAVNPRVHGFVQRPDSTLRFVTPDRNTWVD